jgi:hypothetical protein
MFWTYLMYKGNHIVWFICIGYFEFNGRLIFRTLKTTLQLRPMYHRLEERIRSHILISWLALLLVRIVEVKTDETWSAVRKDLDRIHVGHFSSNNGDVHQTSELTAKQRKTLDMIGVESPPRYLNIHPKA